MWLMWVLWITYGAVLYGILRAWYLLIVDLRKDASLDDIDAYIGRSNLGWVNSLVYRLTFRHLLLPRSCSRHQFADMSANSAFAGASIEASGIGFEVALQKASPVMRSRPTSD